MITEATNESAHLHLHLKHSDGAVTSVSVIERSSGGHYLLVTGPGKWTYESFLVFGSLGQLRDRYLIKIWRH